MNSRFGLRFFFFPLFFFPTISCLFFDGPLTVPHGQIGWEAQAVAGISSQGSMAGRSVHLVEGLIDGGFREIHSAEIKIHKYPQNKKSGQLPPVQVALNANP